jgi:hypothetical protein
MCNLTMNISRHYNTLFLHPSNSFLNYFFSMSILLCLWSLLVAALCNHLWFASCIVVSNFFSLESATHLPIDRLLAVKCIWPTLLSSASGNWCSSSVPVPLTGAVPKSNQEPTDKRPSFFVSLSRWFRRVFFVSFDKQKKNKQLEQQYQTVACVASLFVDAHL